MSSEKNPAQDPIKVALVGATGKMGQFAIDAVNAADDMALVAKLSSKHPLEDISAAGATHVLVLTVHDVSSKVVQFAVIIGLHTEIGTSGWTPDRRSVLGDPLAEHPNNSVLISPHFSIDAVLATRYAVL